MTTPTVPTVYLACPTYDGRIEHDTAAAWLRHPTNGLCRVGHHGHRGSLLAFGFNDLWCQAVNLAAKGTYNRFAMLHADVCPEEQGWLDRLERILQETGADVVSVVVPIKDMRGLTSTAIGDREDPWRVRGRITMRELMNMPQTFRGCDYEPYPDGVLLVNTGCWMARLDRGDWQRRVHFEIRDRIVELEGGELKAQCMPEDWHFSHQLRRLGVDVVATRAVAVRHVGRMEFVNNQVWGKYERDPSWVGETDNPEEG